MEEGDQEGKAASEDHPCGHLGPTFLGNSGRWFRECFRGLLAQGQGSWAIYPVASPGYWVGALPGVSVLHLRAKQLWQLEETYRQVRELMDMGRALTAPAAPFERAGQAGSLAWKQMESYLGREENPSREATDFRGSPRGEKSVDAPVRLARTPAWLQGWEEAVLTTRGETVLKEHVVPRP